MQVVEACFCTRNVTKFSFDNCRGCAMLVNSGLVLRRSDNAVFTVVEVVLACLPARNILKPNFHICSGCTRGVCVSNP